MIYYFLVKKIFQSVGKKMCQMCQGFVERESKILDFGCGSGIVGKEFQDYFKVEILGVDIVDKRIVKIPFQKINGETIPFPENFFDVVLISYVLHHARDSLLLLREAKRVGKKIIVFEDLPEGFLSKIYCRIHSLSYKIFFKNQGQGDFKREKEWQKIFEGLGFNILYKKRFQIFITKRILFVLEK